MRHTGRKFVTEFHIKDPTQNHREYDLVCYNKYPEPICNEDYLSEAGRRIERNFVH